jgi:hypothetical protein
VLIYEEEADISNRERLLDKILYDYDFTLFFKDAYGSLPNTHARLSTLTSLHRAHSLWLALPT